MIQDDYGNLVHTPGTASITERLDDGDARMTRIEHDLAENTQATKEVAASTSELVDILNALKGAFRTLDFIGKLARPLGYIVSLGTATATASTLSLTYPFDPLATTYTLRVRLPGYDPLDLPYTNTTAVVVPVAQQINADGFGVAIYGRGQGTTDAFVTPDGPALRVDIGNHLCVAEDVYDVLAAWQATATGMRYPEVMRFDGRDLLLMGSWRLRRALAAYTSAGIDAAVVVDGMPTASPDDEVNGSVDIRAKAVRTYQLNAAPALTAVDVASAVWAFTLSTGNTAESDLLAAKTAASNAFAVSA